MFRKLLNDPHVFQARDVGIAENKWLMVNVQNVMEFSCQMLNRDIWSNKAIRTIVKEEFIFWQVCVCFLFIIKIQLIILFLIPQIVGINQNHSTAQNA